jgi:hypothetical protein
MRSFLHACIFFLAAAGVNGLAYTHIDTNTTLPTRDIHQFPNATFVENLAIRQNGQIIVTVLTAPELYQVDPVQTENSPALIHRIPDAIGLLGIIELQQDIFYVIAGNWSVWALQSTAGSYSVWKIDMRASKVLNGLVHPPAIVSKVTDIPEGVFLNGMTVLDKTKGLVVIGDAGAGAVFTLDVWSGAYSKTIDDPTMKPGGSLPLGINGMKIRDQHLYYANTGQEIFCRIPINSADGTSAGLAEVIVRNFFGDDFSFDQLTGNAYVGQNVRNTVAKITPDGVVTVVAGNLNSALVAGPTSTAFGKTHDDLSILYVTTSGGIGSPVKVEGGKVVAIYT